MKDGGAKSIPTRASIVFWAIAAAFLAALALVHIAARALLLTFAGVLFGTALRGLAEVLSTKLRWRLQPTIAACIAAGLALVIAAAFWAVPHVLDQARELADKLQQSYQSLRESATAAGAAAPVERLLRSFTSVGQQLQGVVSRAAGFLASAAGAAGALMFVVFVALYTAIGADVYRRGLLHLVPPARRARAGHLLGQLASTSRRWLLGRMVSMLFVALATSLGLWLMNVPLPLTLGVLAGVLGFVPNFGPLVSVIPAALLAFSVGPWHVMYALALYLGINLVDGYALTPWLQKRAVALPPALILSSQVVLGALWGVLGVAFATPLTACLLVLIRELYVSSIEGRAPVSG